MIETLYLSDPRDGAHMLGVSQTYQLPTHLARILRRIAKGISDRAGVGSVVIDLASDEPDAPIRDSRKTIRFSHVQALMLMGLMDVDLDAYHTTYRITKRGQQVVELLEEKAKA